FPAGRGEAVFANGPGGWTSVSLSSPRTPAHGIWPSLHRASSADSARISELRSRDMSGIQTNTTTKMLAGAAGGFAATAPMTAAMLLMHRLLPPQHRYALPPRHVTMNVADALQFRHTLDEGERHAL